MKRYMFETHYPNDYDKEIIEKWHRKALARGGCDMSTFDGPRYCQEKTDRGLEWGWLSSAEEVE